MPPAPYLHSVRGCEPLLFGPVTCLPNLLALPLRGARVTKPQSVQQVEEELDYVKNIKAELNSFTAPPKPVDADPQEDPDVWGPPPPKPAHHAAPVRAPVSRARAPPVSRARAPRRDSGGPSRRSSNEPGRNVGGLYQKPETEHKNYRAPSRKPKLDTGINRGGASKADEKKDGKKKKKNNFNVSTFAPHPVCSRAQGTREWYARTTSTVRKAWVPARV